MYTSTAAKRWHYLILALVAVGFFTELIRSPFSIIVPLLIIGTIYYLYKFPPRWLLQITSSSRPVVRRTNHLSKGKPETKKRRRFRVINGNKKEML
ncbi:hypothetical protein ACFO25_01780 [Paenactinomyces guangxiensis]|uniref:Uncharacterized protein n=1 Tax=Paenactinomyces guangxiensis TaxID=1490290 RepID=A0A7W2A9J9_9BACL|nr:hypothetical protein [Paenactinomyces guangxiensis]MBA4494958.1 hypothetical protein [Paenactinomyces guangxiensis]MBH8592041.1 hypothetical protein [Paenactinomyces guangxiensis]